jgi:hypothetical protein
VGAAEGREWLDRGAARPLLGAVETRTHRQAARLGAVTIRFTYRLQVSYGVRL